MHFWMSTISVVGVGTADIFAAEAISVRLRGWPVKKAKTPPPPPRSCKGKTERGTANEPAVGTDAAAHTAANSAPAFLLTIHTSPLVSPTISSCPTVALSKEVGSSLP